MKIRSEKFAEPAARDEEVFAIVLKNKVAGASPLVLGQIGRQAVSFLRLEIEPRPPDMYFVFRERDRAYRLGPVHALHGRRE